MKKHSMIPSLCILSVLFALTGCAKEEASESKTVEPVTSERQEIEMPAPDVLPEIVPEEKTAPSTESEGEKKESTVSVIHSAKPGEEKKSNIVYDYSYETFQKNLDKAIARDGLGAVYFVDMEKMPKRPVYANMSDEELEKFNLDALRYSIDNFNLGYIDRENEVFVNGFGMKQTKDGTWSQAVPYINGHELPDYVNALIHGNFSELENTYDMGLDEMALLITQGHAEMGAMFELYEGKPTPIFWYGDRNFMETEDGAWYERVWREANVLPEWEEVYRPE